MSAEGFELPVMAQLARERGFYRPSRRDLRLSRLDIKYDVMYLLRRARGRSIERLGREVAPPVRDLLTTEPTNV
jgi:hypothetical protein